jgi:hypothetical protein
VTAAQAKQALLERENAWNWWAYSVTFDLPNATINKDLTAGWPLADG